MLINISGHIIILFCNLFFKYFFIYILFCIQIPNRDDTFTGSQIVSLSIYDECPSLTCSQIACVRYH